MALSSRAIGAAAANADAPVVPLPRPFQEAYFPFLDGEEATGSVSVGDVTRGLLVNARPLPDTGDLGGLPAHAGRDLHHGTAETIALLESAAREHHERTGARLVTSS